MKSQVRVAKKPVFIRTPSGLDLVGPPSPVEPIATWLRFGPGAGALNAEHVQLISVDPGAKDGGVVGIVRAAWPEHEERLILLSAEELRPSFEVLCDRVRAAADYWPGRTIVLCEDSTLGPSLASVLAAHDIPVELVPATGGKGARLLRCAALPFGLLHRVPSTTGGWAFLDAILAMPRSEALAKHSHVLDALSQLLGWTFGLEASAPRMVLTGEIYEVLDGAGDVIGHVWRDGGSRWRYCLRNKIRAPRFEPSLDVAASVLRGEHDRAGGRS